MIDLISEPTTADELLRLFLTGKAGASADSAFASLFRLLNPRLSAYCYKLVPEAWEDIVQEVWEKTIKLRERREDASEIQSAESFIFRIAKNLCMDHYRSKHETEELTEDASVPPTEHSLDWLVTESLEKLSFEDREVLVLNIYSGYKLSEIAAMQSKSEDAIWARASRARMRLRSIVEIEARRHNITLQHTSKKKLDITNG